MNSHLPASLTLSFTSFSQRGGCTDHHGDGWGIAFFESDDSLPSKGIRHFVDKHRPQTAKHIAGYEVVGHPSENELVVIARKYFVQYDLMAGTPVPT